MTERDPITVEITPTPAPEPGMRDGAGMSDQIVVAITREAEPANHGE